MDDHNIPLLSSSSPSPFYSSNWDSHGMVEEKRHEELQQTLLYHATMEQLRRMEGEVASIRTLLHTTIRERDEARLQCHDAMVLLHVILQLEQQNMFSENGISGNFLSTSSEENSIVSPPPPPAMEMELEKPELPEKGRLLEEVMKAGPLLKNLLLIGPLPKWHHPPPPPSRSFEIQVPPVSINTTLTTMAIEGGSRKKRKERDGHQTSTWRDDPLLEAVDYQ